MPRERTHQGVNGAYYLQYPETQNLLRNVSVSKRTRDQINERIKHYMKIPRWNHEPDPIHKKKVEMIYAQMRVLHDILTREWECPADLRIALYTKTPPLSILRFSSDFIKCFIGSTTITGSHKCRLDFKDVLNILQLPEERLRDIAEQRLKSCLAKLNKNKYSLIWNNGCCFVLRSSMPQDFMCIPVTHHVFFPGFAPRACATPAQMYQASRIIESNERLFCTPIYATLVESLSYMMRVAKFDEDPFLDTTPPVFIRPAYAIMVDVSPSHGRSLFVTITKKEAASFSPGTPVVLEGTTLEIGAGVIRPSFPSGEHYAFDYLKQKGKSSSKTDHAPSNLVSTTEAKFSEGERIDVGSPIFYANCSHDGNSYVYTVEIDGEDRGIIQGISSIYKMTVLTAARDLYVADFVAGEKVAVKAGYTSIHGLYRLALEYKYSNTHMVKASQGGTLEPGFKKCECLSYCFKRQSDWYFFVDPHPKTPSDVEYGLSYIQKMKVPQHYKEGVKKWINFAKQLEEGSTGIEEEDDWTPPISPAILSNDESTDEEWTLPARSRVATSAKSSSSGSSDGEWEAPTYSSILFKPTLGVVPGKPLHSISTAASLSLPLATDGKHSKFTYCSALCSPTPLVEPMTPQSCSLPLSTASGLKASTYCLALCENLPPPQAAAESLIQPLEPPQCLPEFDAFDVDKFFSIGSSTSRAAAIPEMQSLLDLYGSDSDE